MIRRQPEVQCYSNNSTSLYSKSKTKVKILVSIAFLFASLSISFAGSGIKETIIIKTQIYCDHCKKCESCGGRINKKFPYIKGVSSFTFDDNAMTFTLVHTTTEKLEKPMKSENNRYDTETDCRCRIPRWFLLLRLFLLHRRLHRHSMNLLLFLPRQLKAEPKVPW